MLVIDNDHGQKRVVHLHDGQRPIGVRNFSDLGVEPKLGYTVSLAPLESGLLVNPFNVASDGRRGWLRQVGIAASTSNLSGGCRDRYLLLSKVEIFYAIVEDCFYLWWQSTFSVSAATLGWQQ